MGTVVVDVMGSDLGSEPLVRGACQFSLEEEVDLILVGDAQEIVCHMANAQHNAKRIRVEHAEDVIHMNENPRVFRPESSLYKAAQLVLESKGSALVSAGNTGAVVVCSAKTFQRLPKVETVALAAVYPTRNTHGPRQDPFALLLDVGATLHVQAADLVRFAIMGSVYAQVISENNHPKVALLSNGEESEKGAPEVVQAHRILKGQKEIHFVGNIEGVDIPIGNVDVVVCEGFLGNVVLKLIEGVGEIASSWIQSVQSVDKDSHDAHLLDPLYSRVFRFAQLTDWRQYGGAPILGFDQVVIKAHGRSTPHAIRNAIKLANRAVERDMISKIRHGMSKVSP